MIGAGAVGPSGSSATYDALGNKVEENVGGVIHEYVSAFGVSAQMTGSTAGIRGQTGVAPFLLPMWEHDNFSVDFFAASAVNSEI